MFGDTGTSLRLFLNRESDFFSFEAVDALFLDGTVSWLYDLASERNDLGLAMGPMVGAVIKVGEDTPSNGG